MKNPENASTAPRQDLRPPRGATPVIVRVRVLAGIAVSLTLLTLGALVLPVIGCLTLFRARRLYAEGIARWMARAGLWCCGIRIVEHRDFDWPRSQTVFISNHTSSLDVIVVTALGLPRTRYFLSGFLRKIVPIGVIGYVMGVFWTAPQSQPAKRTRLFQKAEAVLRRTGESVFLTPEGQQIGRFNKGAFHLATRLRAPILPMFIDIPADVDPGPWSSNQKLDLRPGRVDVHFGPAIETGEWKLDDLEANRDSVKELYAAWDRKLHPEKMKHD